MCAGFLMRSTAHSSHQAPLQQQQPSALTGGHSQPGKPAPALSHFSVPLLRTAAAAPTSQPVRELQADQPREGHAQQPMAPSVPQGAPAAACSAPSEATSSGQAQQQRPGDAHADLQAGSEPQQQHGTWGPPSAWQDNRLWEGRGLPALDWTLHPTPPGTHACAGCV